MISIFQRGRERKRDSEVKYVHYAYFSLLWNLGAVGGRGRGHPTSLKLLHHCATPEALSHQTDVLCFLRAGLGWDRLFSLDPLQLTGPCSDSHCACKPTCPVPVTLSLLSQAKSERFDFLSSFCNLIPPLLKMWHDTKYRAASLPPPNEGTAAFFCL